MCECSRKDSTWVTLRNRFPKRSKESKNTTDTSVPFGRRKQFASSQLTALGCFPAETSPQGCLWSFPIKEHEGTACSAPGGGQRLAKFLTVLQSFPAAMKSRSSPTNIFKRAQSSRPRNLNKEHVLEESGSGPTMKGYVHWSLKTAEPCSQSIS